MQCLDGIDTPAHVSANEGDIDCMRAFIGAGFDINARGGGGYTILHQVIFGGVKMVKYLIEHAGGERLVNSKDNFNQTPLHLHQQKEIGVWTLLQNIQTFYSVLGVLGVRGTPWTSVAHVLGVLQRRGTLIRAWLQLAMGEASGRLLALRAGSRPSRTRGQCAGSSRTMGPGTLLHAGLTVSSMPSRLSTLDSQKTTNTKTSDCVCTALPSTHGLAHYPDPCLTKLFN